MLKSAYLPAICLALTALVALPGRTLAQQASTIPDAKYHLAVAKTHTVHAADDALLLKRYASQHKTVPADMLKEHTAAMNLHLQTARKSYARLAAAAKAQPDQKNQADLLKQIEILDQRLAKVSGMVKTIETRETEADKVALQAGEISSELATNRIASQAVNNNFYNMDSSNYYEDGLGHFVD